MMGKSVFEIGKIIEIYHNDPTRFDVGKILFVDDIWLIAETYDPEGNFDGFMLNRIENIFKIRYDTQYISNLGVKSAEDNGYKHEEEDLLKDFIKNAVAADSVLCLATMNDDNITGTIRKWDDDHVYIMEYTDNGEGDGITIVDACNVETLQFLNRECVNINKNIKIRSEGKGSAKAN